MRGSILFNGNVVREADFITAFRERILASNHEDPAIRASKKVVMITAAWKKNEYDESHVRASLNAIGVPSRVESGFDVNIQNLAVYHEFNDLRAREVPLYRLYHAKQEVMIEVKRFYRRKNSGLVRLVKEQTALLKKSFPEATLGEVLGYPVQTSRRDLSTFTPRQLQYHYACEDLQGSMQSLTANDAKMVDICNELDLSFQASSGVMQNPMYLEIKRRLEERILSANSLFIFGGYVAVLYNRLNFFKLKGALVEALRRGTNIYTVSAGSGVLCNSIILYDDFSDGEEQGISDFEFFDNGFGVVDEVQIFPHCTDRIQTDDPDNLAYLAHRFRSTCCVGMNQDSYLLMESSRESGRRRERYTSVGEKDGVYVFDTRGRKAVRRLGEEIELP